MIHEQKHMQEEPHELLQRAPHLWSNAQITASSKCYLLEQEFETLLSNLLGLIQVDLNLKCASGRERPLN